MVNKDFLTAGSAIFTLEIPSDFASKKDTPPHYTYKISKKEANGNWPETWFIALLTSPNNDSGYTYVGKLDMKTGGVVLTAKSRYNADSMVVRLLDHALRRIWRDESDKITDAGFDIHHDDFCGRCGRHLTTPLSVKTGLGPYCRKVMGIAVDADEHEESPEEIVAVA